MTVAWRGVSALRPLKPRAIQRSVLHLRALRATSLAAERKVHFDQVDGLFEELGIGKELMQEVGGIRVRQHVNPLKKDLQIPAPPLSWGEAYSEPGRPLVLDIGTGYGRFLLALSRVMPGHNLLGLEIRDQVVERAQKWSEVLGLAVQVQFVRANATVSLESMLSSYPGQLDLVTIQFPDPHFKRKHRKRRVVQAQLVAALARLLRPGGRVLLQSDVEEVAASMRDEFEEYGGGAFVLSPLHAPGAVFFSPTPQPPSVPEQQQQEQHAGNGTITTCASGSSSGQPMPGRNEPCSGGNSSSEEGPPFRGASSGYSSGDESGREGGSRAAGSSWGPGGGHSEEQQWRPQQQQPPQQQAGGSSCGDGSTPAAAGPEGQGAATAAAPSRGKRAALTWASGGWLLQNPLGIPTEREVYVTEQGLPVFRVLLVRN